MSVYRQVFFGLGSNIGDSVSHLHWALVQLAASDEVRDLVASPFYQSEAHTLDNVEQPAYINAVAGAKTTLLPIFEPNPKKTCRYTLNLRPQ